MNNPNLPDKKKGVTRVGSCDLLGSTVMAHRLSHLVKSMADAYQTQRLNWEVNLLISIRQTPKAAPAECHTLQAHEVALKPESHPSMSLAMIDDLRAACEARAKRQQTDDDKLWHRILVAYG